MKDTMITKCFVAVTNSNGEPDFHFVLVKCTTKQFTNGEHYLAAKESAEDNGYEAYLAYDHVDGERLKWITRKDSLLGKDHWGEWETTVQSKIDITKQ